VPHPAMRHRITMSGLPALCGLALLVEHVFHLDPYTGDHLVAGALMLAIAVIVWFLPSKPRKNSAKVADLLS
jgi:hypothetical protein